MKLPSARALRPSRTWVVLGVALLFGLLAALLAGRYLSKRLAEIENRPQERTTQVLVAKQDLQAGTPLSTANVSIRDVPAEFAQSLAIRESQWSSVDGRILGFDLKSGEQLLWPLLEGPKVATFSARVAPGRRAITVAVDEISSISGLLEPGDFIDLLITFTHAGQKMTAPLLQDVQVLATGQRSVDDPRSGQTRTYSTVTLDTSWEEAQNIVVGRENGRLTALLRNPDDKEAVPGVITDLAGMLSDRAPVVDGLREVPVMYGGRGGSSIPPEALHLGNYVAATPARRADRGDEAARFLESLQRLREIAGGTAQVADDDDSAAPQGMSAGGAPVDAGAGEAAVPVLSGGPMGAR